MESLDYWRLCDHLSVSQAALLVAGHDPGATGEDFADWEPWNYPKGYSAALNAIQNAVMAGSISATIRTRKVRRGFRYQAQVSQLSSMTAR